jgi:hypothetical protein
LILSQSVTESSFASPCKPLAGGVDSGFQSVAADATNIPEFSIAINNASKPLFFFSAQTVYAFSIVLQNFQVGSSMVIQSHQRVPERNGVLH